MKNLQDRGGEVSDRGKRADVTTQEDERTSPVNGLRTLAARYGVLMFLLLMVVVFSAWLPDRFATLGNFQTIVNSYAILMLLAGTATLVLRTGDFDLSIANTMVFSGAVATVTSTNGLPLPAVLGLSIAVGVAVGAVNGFLVVKVGVGSLIVTLGMLTALGGFTFGVTGNAVVAGVPADIRAVARTQVFGITTLTLIGWAFIALLWYVYERTPVGRHMLFVGGNPDAARLAGLPVGRIRFLTFMVSSSMAGFTGFLLAGQLGAMDPSIGPQFLLQPFAAAFLGATTIHVGRFNAVGTLVALYLIAVGITGLQLIGAEPWVSSVFNGGALVTAVTLARLVARDR
ncbi:MAG: ABC transporter permease [Actinomycetota bacterium]